MFRPIKNLITYIQKNASGGAIFGATTVIDEVNANTTAVIAKSEPAAEQEHNDFITSSKEKYIKIEMEEANKNEEQSTDQATVLEGAAESLTLPSSYDDGDDIEMQIKSSVMLKKPATDGHVNLAVLTNAGNNLPASETHNNNSNIKNNNNSINDNSTTYATLQVDDELEDFRHDPMQAYHVACADDVANCVDDFHSVCSTDHTGDERDDLSTAEEEEQEETFIDGASTYTNSEIIVLSDSELNSSITSDVPSEDPLAIEEFGAPAIEIIPLESGSTTDEGSADMLWIGVVEGEKALTSSPLTNEQPPENTENMERVRHSLNTSTSEERPEELRSDGSDSGLGSETSTLQNTLNTATDTDTSQVCSSALSTPVQTPMVERNRLEVTTYISTGENAVVPTASTSSAIVPVSMPTPRKPLRSNLKRRVEDADDALDTTISRAPKMQKRSINFDNVHVFYFQRQQGFGCVPSAGGCTLGMSARHSGSKVMSLTEHAAEIRRAHRLQLQEINPRGSSSDESEESEEDYLSEGSGSDLDAESNGFLQPVSPKQRRALLKAAGVRKIDASEKIECRDIRNSREVCGCTCRDFCDPDTCACSQAGIKCQVDRAMFPCGCSRDACLNTVGRIEFNPARVRTHFIHTLMRLEMEKRQQQNPAMFCGSGAIFASTATSMQSIRSSQAAAHYYNMQTQSNYSSGYASPAYTSEQTANYYQPQQQVAHYNGVGASDMHQQTPSSTVAATSAYQMDTMDGGLFATSSYSELMPSYGGSMGIAGVASPTAMYHNMSYAAVSSSNIQSQVSQYATYHNHHQMTGNYMPVVHNGAPTSAQSNVYSSCALQSLPPYGTATTTAANSQYHNITTLALDTTAPSCSSIEESGTDGNSFISLSTPIASSSRFSQINDLLQHNRNTTAALVVISQCSSSTSTSLTSISSCSNTTLASNISTTSLTSLSSTFSKSLLQTTDASSTEGEEEEEPREDHKSCLTCEELPPSPVVAPPSDNSNKNNTNETASMPCPSSEQTETEIELKTALSNTATVSPIACDAAVETEAGSVAPVTADTGISISKDSVSENDNAATTMRTSPITTTTVVAATADATAAADVNAAADADATAAADADATAIAGATAAADAIAAADATAAEEATTT